jgi:hypothetical protein
MSFINNNSLPENVIQNRIADFLRLLGTDHLKDEKNVKQRRG